MEKVLIVTPHIIVGGVEKALINMLSMFQKDKYDVTVRFIKCQGDFKDSLPHYNNIHYDEIPIGEREKQILLSGGTKKVLQKLIKSFSWFTAIKVILKKIKASPFSDYLGNFDKIPVDNTVYDYAICYHMHMPFIVAYVSKKINANNKICWIHSDFKTTKLNVNSMDEYLCDYNQFMAVSEQLKDEFIDICPNRAKDIKLFHNLINTQEILDKANLFVPKEFEKETLNILSVGRLSAEKGFDLAINIAYKLKNKNIKFKWFVVGEGKERNNLSKMIKTYNLEEYFILLGLKCNPYPYMKNCDIYVQPSRHEGYGITLAEAKILGKKIIATNFAGAHEQLDGYSNGVVVNFDEIEIINAIINNI